MGFFREQRKAQHEKDLRDSLLSQKIETGEENIRRYIDQLLVDMNREDFLGYELTSLKQTIHGPYVSSFSAELFKEGQKAVIKYPN